MLGRPRRSRLAAWPPPLLLVLLAFATAQAPQGLLTRHLLSELRGARCGSALGAPSRPMRFCRALLGPDSPLACSLEAAQAVAGAGAAGASAAEGEALFDSLEALCRAQDAPDEEVLRQVLTRSALFLRDVKHDPGKAARKLELLARRRALDAEEANNMVVLWFEAGRADKALEAFEAHRALLGTDVRAVHNLARVLHGQGRLEEARLAYRDVLPPGLLALRQDQQDVVLALALLDRLPDGAMHPVRWLSSEYGVSAETVRALRADLHRVGLEVVNHLALLRLDEGSPELLGAPQLYQPLLRVESSERSSAGAPPVRIALIVQLYAGSSDERAAEMAEALTRNLAVAEIDLVVAFVPRGVWWGRAIEPHAKLRLVPTDDDRLSLGFLVRYGLAMLPRHAVLVANADIYFDGSLSLLRALDEASEDRPPAVVSLLRREGAGAGARLFPRIDCQDAWFFSTVFWARAGRDRRRALLGELDKLYQGRPGVDNRLTALVRAHQLRVLNFGLFVRAFHLHAARGRSVTSRDHVAGELEHALLATTVFVRR